MRAMSTDYIVDENKPLIQELYMTRMELNFHRALQEIRLFHLPIQVPPKYNLTPMTEEDLMVEQQLKIHLKLQCPVCTSVRPLYGQHTLMCLECWSLYVSSLWKDFPIKVNSFAQIVNSPTYIPDYLQFLLKEDWIKHIVAATLKELVAASRQQLHFYPHTSKETIHGWTSPKKTFMAMEFGCRECGFKYPYKDNWLWSADLSDWRNGFCPRCTELDTGYPEVWNMNAKEYAEWQDSFAIPSRLHRTMARYGALSLLLVSTNYKWVRFVVSVVPNSPHNMTLYNVSKRLGNIHRTVGIKAKSLRDINLDLEDHLPVRSIY